ncbi:MAG: metallophosphoesterase [Methanomassiliicoccaceae archaeon]|nr:metallophosphoesterase [Methanomassiliicoccaceae archaeon]
MKLLVITDIHGNESVTGWINSVAEKENVDCVLILGDITDFGPDWVAEKILSSIKRKVYALPGNCDPLSIPGTLSSFAINMHGKTTVLDKFHVAGLGGSNPTPFGTPFELEEEVIYKMLKPISKEGMILMVHAPPYGINDKAPSGVSVGSKSILRIVNEFKPILVLSGHMHESRGIECVNGTTFVNPGPARDNLYALIEIDKSGTVKAELFKAGE